jgi:hypothetical protein
MSAYNGKQPRCMECLLLPRPQRTKCPIKDQRRTKSSPPGITRRGEADRSHHGGTVHQPLLRLFLGVPGGFRPGVPGGGRRGVAVTFRSGTMRTSCAARRTASPRCCAGAAASEWLNARSRSRGSRVRDDDAGIMDVADGAVEDDGWEDVVRERRRAESSPRKYVKCALERSVISEAVWVSECKVSTCETCG